MRVILLSSIFLFALSATFKLLHWPGGGPGAILALLTMLVFAIVNSASKTQRLSFGILGGWVIFAWSTYFLGRFFLWTAHSEVFSVILGCAILLSIIQLAYTLFKRERKVSKSMILLLFFGIGVYFIPNSRQVYFFDLNEVVNGENRKSNFYSWDKYSWYLYQEGKFDLALSANDQAIKAWQEDLKQLTDLGLENEVEIEVERLQLHRKAIEAGTWTSGHIWIELREERQGAR